MRSSSLRAEENPFLPLLQRPVGAVSGIPSFGKGPSPALLYLSGRNDAPSACTTAGLGSVPFDCISEALIETRVSELCLFSKPNCLCRRPDVYGVGGKFPEYKRACTHNTASPQRSTIEQHGIRSNPYVILDDYSAP